MGSDEQNAAKNDHIAEAIKLEGDKIRVTTKEPEKAPKLVADDDNGNGNAHAIAPVPNQPAAVTTDVRLPAEVKSSASLPLAGVQRAVGSSVPLGKDGRSEYSKETRLEYRPFASAEKWVEYRFSAFSSAKAWFAISLVVLFLAYGGPGKIVEAILNAMTNTWSGKDLAAVGGVGMSESSQLLLQIFFGFITFIFATIAAIYLSQPTHVLLAQDGLGLEWNRGKRRFRRFMNWDRVESIDLYWPQGKTSPQDCQVRFKDRLGSNQYPVILKLGSIIKEADRNKLLRAIETHCPDAPRDAKLLEFLAPAQDHSYTELWLQALSAPPKRERLTPLSEHSVVHGGRYTVIRQLGVGGQGTAYLAKDNDTAHEIVLKEFILPVYVDTNVLRQALERMQNEAAMLRKLDNDRIVRLIDFFVEDHRGYLVLEKIDGESLLQIVSASGPMSEKQVINLTSQMCEILSYLHNLEPPVIHRDFTPDNLILGKDGILKLVDFNVAQQTESTATGTVVGKHAYISPEQFRGRPTTQSDVYAMGATLQFLLTGEAPEPIKISHPKKTRPEVSNQMDFIVAKATTFDTAARYATIEELRADLSLLLDPSTDKKKSET